MSIFSHNVYDNIRTRVIVLHQGCLLLHPPRPTESAWQLPGGGLEPNESLADCAVREVWEETGVRVQVASVAFLREWVVPTYCSWPEATDQIGFGLEVYLYAYPEREPQEVRPEADAAPLPQWVPLAEIPHLPLWPKELKALALALQDGSRLSGVPSFVAQLESPLALPGEINFVPGFGSAHR
jgi:8-oxo-dGTP pyrophosphatase MutT (NUDIX family)